jgi:hypothetical protein
MNYTVADNDTPARIAHRLTGNPARASELVAANLHKPRVLGLGGVPTFQGLQVGERLNVPQSWAPQGVGSPQDPWSEAVKAAISDQLYRVQRGPQYPRAGYGVGAPAGLGQDGGVPFGDAVNSAVNNAINNNTIIGSGTTAAQGSTAVQNAALNLVSFAGGQTFPCNDPTGSPLVGAFQQLNGGLQVDGDYGPLTQAALNKVLAQIPSAPGAPPVCTKAVAGGGGGGGGGGGVVTPPGGGGLVPVNVVTPSGTTSSMMPLIIGGVVVAGGLATIAYLAHRHQTEHGSPAVSHVHRTVRRFTKHHAHHGRRR